MKTLRAQLEEYSRLHGEALHILKQDTFTREDVVNYGIAMAKASLKFAYLEQDIIEADKIKREFQYQVDNNTPFHKITLFQGIPSEEQKKSVIPSVRIDSATFNKVKAKTGIQKISDYIRDLIDRDLSDAR